jgi:hypothetical protein
MSTQTRDNLAVAFSPRLLPDDELAAYWLRQATVRLRREVCWRWRQTGLALSGKIDPLLGAVPPMTDRLTESLDLTRYAGARQRFYEEDPTAGYLTEQLDATPPSDSTDAPRGSFTWMVQEARLDRAACFVEGLGLLATFDNAAGPVIAACLNDPASTRPTLALAQRLWDDPAEIMRLADPTHALWRYGLIRCGSANAATSAVFDWDQAFVAPGLVAAQLLRPRDELAAGLKPLQGAEDQSADRMPAAAAARLRRAADRLRVVPVIGARGSPFREIVAQTCRRVGRRAVEFVADRQLLASAEGFDAIATLCWLRDLDLFLDLGTRFGPTVDGLHGRGCDVVLPSPMVPLNLFVAVESMDDIQAIPRSVRLPPIEVPRLSYEGRAALWRRGLAHRADELGDAAEECARRFRVERGVIESVCEDLRRSGDAVSREELFAACRAEIQLDLGDLAERIEPRFSADELVLPHKQQVQLDEIRHAMRSLTRVHYEWGTARVWNEAGLSVLFAGPPGTGKTMAAETLARELDLPMYRIDLSEVVNKYVGETPKNLKRIFDAADAADLILFFEEADALYGRRTEVRDAHDRYANIEINYLLTRMEGCKGLTILATNRREDLDDAFMRRLRFIVTFPQPDVDQRRRIWEKSVPEHVDASDLDLDFLARQFPLTGGHIRSAVFHACLQSAAVRQGDSRQQARKLDMPTMVVAVRRELEKQNRMMGLKPFGPYAEHVERLEQPGDSDAAAAH